MQCRGDNEGRVRVSAQQSILTWKFRCAKKYRLYRLQRPQAKKSIKKHAVVKVDDFYANKKPSTAHTKTDTGGLSGVRFSVRIVPYPGTTNSIFQRLRQKGMLM